MQHPEWFLKHRIAEAWAITGLDYALMQLLGYGMLRRDTTPIAVCALLLSNQSLHRKVTNQVLAA